MNREVYRICERKNGELFTLFHGIKGSRKMPMNEWLTADVKIVKDGSKKTSKLYKSGFHTIESLDECRTFTKKFKAKRDLVIVKCLIGENTWGKEHSPSNIILTDRIKLLEIVENITI